MARIMPDGWLANGRGARQARLALASMASLALLAACQTVQPVAGFSAAQVGVLEAEGFRYVDGNYELGLENRVLFEFDRSDLRADVALRLQRLARALADVGITGAMVEGHTDAQGEAGYNAALSRQRAESVRTALAGNGLRFDHIRAEGRGEDEPVASNDTAEGRQENRRVVIVITALDSAPLQQHAASAGLP